MAKRKPNPQKMPSQRQLRAGELIRHALVEILQRGPLRDPALDGAIITVTEVRPSPDLRSANVYVAPMSGGDDRAKGSWRITSDDLYCRRFDNFWARGELGCFRVYDASSSGEVIFDHVSGNQGDSFRYRYKVLAGNPYKL